MNEKLEALRGLVRGLRPDLDEDTIFMVIWHCDLEVFRTLGKSMTGCTWVKTETGVRPLEETLKDGE